MMPSTDRLLWLLQMLLFVAAAALAAIAFLQGTSDPAPPEPCEWIYTYPDGREVKAERQNCNQPEEVSPLVNALLNLMVVLCFIALGAMVFCLRRIAGFLRQIAQRLPPP